ncbi:MAG: hypothetical protein IPH35_05570 [Rhodoferax sp.]|nr:hypothetical protein [Rhodoferax sp.]
MNVVIQVNGRDAIPVRAIPYITSWQVLTPDKLADVLANSIFQFRYEPEAVMNR